MCEMQNGVRRRWERAGLLEYLYTLVAETPRTWLALMYYCPFGVWLTFSPGMVASQVLV